METLLQMFKYGDFSMIPIESDALPTRLTKGQFLLRIPEPKTCEPRKKNLTTVHSTGWLIGILIMAYYNPYITGQYNPLHTPKHPIIYPKW